MRHRAGAVVVAASIVYLVAANVIWIAHDTRPPFWDMALHQTIALKVYDAVASAGPAAIASIPSLTGQYPPLYHSIVAVFYGVFGKTVDAAQYANLAAVALLAIATYHLGLRLSAPGGQNAAAAAAVLVSFYPMMLWLSRETVIDYWLTAMVALAVWRLYATAEFSDRQASVVFGLVCGLGMLTKWTFPLFVAAPAAWLARKNPRNAAIAAVIAAAIAAAWYLPAVPTLAGFLRTNMAGALAEGDPDRLSLQAVIFYIRAMAGYQLFLPLFAAFVAGAVLVARDVGFLRGHRPRLQLRQAAVGAVYDRARGSGAKAWAPILLWLIGGWLGLMLFQNKDPRYSAPLLPAVALITARLFQNRARFALAMAPLLLFQHYLVSFGIPQLPETVVLSKGRDGPLPWNWNLYTQTYFGLWGRPLKQDWPISQVLDAVSAAPSKAEFTGHPVRLGIIPEMPRFDPYAFEFYIALRKLPVVVNRIRTADAGVLADNDYILTSPSAPRWSFLPDPKDADAAIHARPEMFQFVARFALPDGDVVELYKVRGR